MALFLLAEKLCNLHFLNKYTGGGLFFYSFRKYLMTLLVLQQTHPVTNFSVPISKARSPNFYRNIFRKFPLRWDQHFIKELMELLCHVHWMKTKPPCIYLNVDPVCVTGVHRLMVDHFICLTNWISVFLHCLNYSEYLLIHVWLQLCLHFYHSLCSYLSFQFHCFCQPYH